VIPATYDSTMFEKDTEYHMPWTETTRAQHDRRCLRYASDVSDG